MCIIQKYLLKEFENNGSNIIMRINKIQLLIYHYNFLLKVIMLSLVGHSQNI